VGRPKFQIRALLEIIRLLRDRGHFDAAVLDEYFLPADGRTAEVGLDVRPGPRARGGSYALLGRARDEPRKKGRSGLSDRMASQYDEPFPPQVVPSTVTATMTIFAIYKIA